MTIQRHVTGIKGASPERSPCKVHARILLLPATDKNSYLTGHRTQASRCMGRALWSLSHLHRNVMARLQLKCGHPRLSLAASVFMCIYDGVHRCSTKRKNTITASVTDNVSDTNVTVTRTSSCSKHKKRLLNLRSGPSQQAFRPIHLSTFSENWPTCFMWPYIFLLLCRRFDQLSVLSSFS